MDKEALLELCPALVLPSYRRAEAFGVVLLEAMRASKPLISCEIGSGMSYANQHEVTGLIVAPKDSGALAAAMTRLFNNPDTAQRMGKAGHARFREHFDQRNMCEAYLNLYVEMLKRN